jgi:hypothetical protein
MSSRIGLLIVDKLRFLLSSKLAFTFLLIISEKFLFVPKQRRGLKRLRKSSFDHRDYVMNIDLQGSNKFEISGHNYAKTFSKYLNNYRYTCKNLLEIGVLTGSTLCIWASMFPNSKIYGIDLEKQYWDQNIQKWTKKLGKQNMSRILFVNRDIFTVNEASEIFGQTYFDIIIDDGPHDIMSVLKSFSLFQERLSQDGTYIVEDNPGAIEDLKHLGKILNFRFFVENGLIIGKREAKINGVQPF